MAERASPLRRHVVLIGLPGAGKSTLGARLAHALHAQWVDLDAELEQRSGRSVAELFAEQGEPAFRAMECALTEELLARAPLVWSTGGGWVTAGDALTRALAVAHVVHLRVSVPEAARRLRGQGKAGAVRPLLAGENLESALGHIWERRSALYARAHQMVDVEDVDLQRLTDLLRASVARALDPRVG